MPAGYGNLPSLPFSKVVLVVTTTTFGGRDLCSVSLALFYDFPLPRLLSGSGFPPTRILLVRDRKGGNHVTRHPTPHPRGYSSRHKYKVVAECLNFDRGGCDGR